MSCDACNEAEEEGRIIYYRIEDATIGIVACDKHFTLAAQRLGVGERVLCQRDMYWGRNSGGGRH